MKASSRLPVVLFGYESSPFTWKVRYVLKLKQIPYTFITVPSMMPRPILKDNFHITYRKIPVCAIGRELYCDTSLICEALEHSFQGHGPSIYPQAADGRNYRPMIRGFASYWTDRPFFRVTTGLIPDSVWRTSFGMDRAGLIGHKLDPAKLGEKLPRNYSSLDMQLSMLEPLFDSGGPWIFSTATPSLADISLFYQLQWGIDIAAGRGLNNLTGGGIQDANNNGTSAITDGKRYPGIHKWFMAVRKHFADLPSTENLPTSADAGLDLIKTHRLPAEVPLIPTPNLALREYDEMNGLKPGTVVSVAPDDTGRDDPTIGTLIDVSPEEIVIKPQELGGPPPVEVRIHFPRLGFVARPRDHTKL